MIEISSSLNWLFCLFKINVQALIYLCGTKSYLCYVIQEKFFARQYY